MTKIVFNEIGIKLELKKGINIVSIENVSVFRNLYYNFFNNITYSENDSPVDISKYTLLINNPLNLDLNEKKILNLLYKKIISNIVDKDRVKISEIEELSNELFDDLIYKTGLLVEYSPIVDINKLLSAFNLQFKEIEYSNYLDYIMNYISTNLELSKYKLILTFNLLNSVSSEEIASLKKEIEYQDIILLDISYNNRYKDSTIIIDNDLCMI